MVFFLLHIFSSFLPFPVYFSNANATSILSNIQLMFNSRKVLISKMGQSLKMMCTAHLFELSSLHCAAGFIVNPEEHEADASNAKYCNMFQDVRFTFAILSSCMCSKQGN